MWLFRLIRKLFWKIMDGIDILWVDRARLRKAKESQEHKNYDVAVHLRRWRF
jgi:hypothetical protein